MKLINKIKLSILILVLISLLFCGLGCSLKAEQKSLTDQFVTIDSLINQNQIDTALKELKKAEKRVFDSWSYLGVYKRYIVLGKNNLGEKVILKALKDFPDNVELNAVYTNFLIENNRLNEAEKYGKKILNSEYGSLYSEVVLRQTKLLADSDLNFNFFKDNDFYSVFYNAYLGSRNPVWIRNCGIFDLREGRYSRIGEIAPDFFSDVDDAFFWALALYDSGNYCKAIEAVKQSQNFLKDYNSLNKFKTSAVEQTALLSDAYMCLSDMENAEKARQELILNMDNLSSKESIMSNSLLPVIITNSAIWAYNQELYDQCADLLFYIVNQWPDFVPGLVLYSDFAYNSNNSPKENREIEALREAGLATISMEKYDNRRKIPLSDAKYRIDQALARNNNPYLSIIQLDLKYKLDKSLNDKDKYRDIWVLLESNYEKSGEYESLLIQYALNYLLLDKNYKEAWTLFKEYICNISNIDNMEDFWHLFITNVKSYDLPIVEFGAWFCGFMNLREEALRLFEYCVYESSGLNEDGFIAKNVSSATCINLGDVYFSIGMKNKALDLYGKTAGRESKKSVRSEIFYRIACIYISMGDNKNALRSAEYACELYPENVRASLLKDKLRTKI